jgi:hypothetical protein
LGRAVGAKAAHAATRQKKETRYRGGQPAASRGNPPKVKELDFKVSLKATVE